MNWPTYRLLAGTAILMALAAIGLMITSDFHEARLHLGWQVLVAGMIPLPLAALMAIRLRQREWRDQPEKAQRLALLPAANWLVWAALLVTVLMLVFD